MEHTIELLWEAGEFRRENGSVPPWSPLLCPLFSGLPHEDVIYTLIIDWDDRGWWEYDGNNPIWTSDIYLLKMKLDDVLLPRDLSQPLWGYLKQECLESAR